MTASNRYIVRVKGDIVLKDHTIQCAQEWVCYGAASQNTEDDYYPQEPSNIITNLYFSEDRSCIPYAIYVSEKDISGDGITLWSGYGPAIIYAKNEIERIRKASNIEISTVIQNSYYKGLFIECFSCLEQFLCDFVLCGIYYVGGCYERAEQYRNSKQNKNKDLHTFYFTYVYHKFDKVSDIFRRVLDFELPDMSYFEEKNIVRNDIVHRASLTKIDRMTYRIISKSDVVDLVEQIDCLLKKLSVYTGSSYQTIENLVYRFF